MVEFVFLHLCGIVIQVTSLRYCVEFQSVPHKISYPYVERYTFYRCWKYSSSQIYELVCVFETPLGVVYVHQCGGSSVIQIVAWWIMTSRTHKNQCLWNLINEAFPLKVSSANWRSFHCGRNALIWHQYITDTQSRRIVYMNGMYYMFRCVSGDFKRWRRTLFMWKVYGDSKALVGWSNLLTTMERYTSQ